MKLIPVLGATGSGKTTHCDRILEAYLHGKRFEGGPRPIVLKAGRFFRETLGEETFLGPDAGKGDHPITRHWVRSLVHHALLIGTESGRDVVLDGFPKSLPQWKWLFTHAFDLWVQRIEVHIMYLPQPEADRRLQKRHNGDADALRLARERLGHDAGAIATIVDAIRRSVEEGEDRLELQEWAGEEMICCLRSESGTTTTK